MGVIDEHWCSECKKEIDKSKEKYVEASLLNDKDSSKFDRIWLCKKCAQAKKIDIGGHKISVWTMMQRLREKGNPSFEISINCHAAPVCDTYKPRKDQANCAHIAVTPAGKVYCKRNHPGFVTLRQEKSLVEQHKVNVHQEMTLQYCKRMGFKNPADMLDALGMDKRVMHQPRKLEPLGFDPTLSKETKKALGQIFKMPTIPAVPKVGKVPKRRKTK